MTTYKKKRFFQEPTKAMIIKANTTSADDNLVDRIESLEENEALIIERILIPSSYETPRKFLKHGPEVKTKRVYTLEEMAKERFVPIRLREEAFNGIKNTAYCAYSFTPFAGKDRKKRKVSLYECLEAARLFYYAHNIGSRIEFRAYENSKRVESEGAVITVKVPSRTHKKPKYDFNLVSVPVKNNENKFAIAQNIASFGHNCKKKQYGFRYKYKEDKESSDVFSFCAHEIATYFKIIDDYWDKKNITLLEMSQFAIPTKRTVEYYKRLCDSVLIRDDELKTKDRLRGLNKAEKEILLWGLVYKYKHDETFFAKREKIENYDWQLRHMD